MAELMSGADCRGLTEAEVDAMAWDHELDAAAALESCVDYDGNDDLAGLCL